MTVKQIWQNGPEKHVIMEPVNSSQHILMAHIKDELVWQEKGKNQGGWNLLHGESKRGPEKADKVKSKRATKVIIVKCLFKIWGRVGELFHSKVKNAAFLFSWGQ